MAIGELIDRCLKILPLVILLHVTLLLSIIGKLSHIFYLEIICTQFLLYIDVFLQIGIKLTLVVNLLVKTDDIKRELSAAGQATEN